MKNKIDDYKLVIITGENEKSDDIDGEVIFAGKNEDYSFHIDALIDYSRGRYPNVNVFQHINDRHLPNVPIFFLTWLNSIVYANTSSERAGNCGMLYMPDEISEKQREALLKLAEAIPTAQVCIVYDMDFDDGEVKLKEFKYKKSHSFYEALNEFLKMNEKKSKKI